MAKKKAEPKPKRYRVDFTVEWNGHTYVEAYDEDDAREQAEGIAGHEFEPDQMPWTEIDCVMLDEPKKVRAKTSRKAKP